ncbi:MAG: hypothetical protein AB7E32_12810 [Desulfovibrio sp.]
MKHGIEGTLHGWSCLLPSLVRRCVQAAFSAGTKNPRNAITHCGDFFWSQERDSNSRSADYEENVWKISIEIIELVLLTFVYRGKKAYLGIHSVYQKKIHDFWAVTFDFLICYA